jgi:hypothetical protein
METMGLRTRSIDTHEKKAEIIKALVSGRESYQNISERYGISKTAICTYLKDRLYPQVASARIAEDKKAGKTMLERIEREMVYSQKMYESCNDWLQDPTNPDRYELGPRGYEINVVYRDENGHQQKATLQTLLDRISGSQEFRTFDLFAKVADPRRLILESANTLNRQLEMLAKVEGLIKENTTAAQDPQTIYMTMIQIVENATKKAPEVRDSIIKALEAAGNT